jgi:hypothetical protein
LTYTVSGTLTEAVCRNSDQRSEAAPRPNPQFVAFDVEARKALSHGAAHITTADEGLSTRPEPAIRAPSDIKARLSAPVQNCRSVRLIKEH